MLNTDYYKYKEREAGLTLLWCLVSLTLLLLPFWCDFFTKWSDLCISRKGTSWAVQCVLWINTKYSLISDLERGQVSVHQTSCAWISIILLYSMSFIEMYPSSSVFAITIWLFWSVYVTNRSSWNWVNFPEAWQLWSPSVKCCSSSIMWLFIWG